MLKITLVKSTIGAIPKHRKTIEALGLRKLGRSVCKRDSDGIRGMIRQVSHMLHVTELSNECGNKCSEEAPK